MTPSIRNYMLPACLGSGVIAVFFFVRLGNVTDHGEYMSLNSIRVQKTFAQKKTICVGRFLFDVPEKSTIIYGPSHAPWPIVTYLGDAKKKDVVVAERLAEVQVEKKMASGDLQGRESLVGSTIDGAAPGQKIVIGVSKGSSSIYKIESYLAVGENLYVQSADPIAAEKDDAIQDLNAIALAIKAREEGDIPVDSGVCLEGGFIAESKHLSYEAFNVGVRLNEFPDVHFSLSVTKKDVLVESDALEPRIRQAEELAKRSGQGAWYSRIKTLRRGKRQIGCWYGFEMLAWKPPQDTEGESHEFLFVSQGQPKNALQPVLELELHTGVSGNRVGAAKPGLTDEEAVEVWDQLISSIRIRPYK